MESDSRQSDTHFTKNAASLNSDPESGLTTISADADSH